MAEEAKKPASAKAPADKEENKEIKKEASKKEDKPKKAELPEIKPGMTIRLYQRIKEGEKERTQYFEGIVLAINGKTAVTRTVTLRKVSEGVGVEKIFPLGSPMIEKIEILKKAKVNQSKLYYLRDYNKKLKEEKVRKEK
ncbi:50S ribosomal protein L19 [Patescibacteria group bacterium]|nr:50S ribosomal protein L19 [Patescibacteria group bacterium]MBU1673187.1 50S ribosomal protein L19 [Patescibacteria group bacterium]MBU1963033.1 50S ribosomal protein L19 [Patescibacteria group bacterium]